MKMSVVMAALLLVAGCAHSGLSVMPVPAPDQAHDVDGRYAYMSCNLEKVVEYHGDDLDAAEQVYLYALMSSNAYTDKGQYAIPGWTRVARFESTSGLALDEWVRDGSSPRQKVVAFRGTEDLKDWQANLALVEPWQHREAYEHIADLRRSEPHTLLTATGHSLGGALALNMSQRFENMPAYVFNSSPRAFFASEGARNQRTVVWETGELLNVFRRPWLGLRMQDAPRMQFNFMDYSWIRSAKVIQEHSMYGLSRGLLVSAAAKKNPHALDVIRVNIRPDNLEHHARDTCASLVASTEGSAQNQTH